MMKFEICEDREVIETLIRRAWDRPEMLRDGANLEEIPEFRGAQYFVAIEQWEYQPIALFIGFETAPDTLDLHMCATPECRGALAIAALMGFLDWMKESPYKVVTGKIPGYNKPMVTVAMRSGFQKRGIIRQSVLRNGVFEDEILMERRLA